MARYFSSVQIKSRDGQISGYVAGCTGYLEDGQLTVVLRHRRSSRLRRRFPVLATGPPTIELADPQDYEGFVPVTPRAA